ncbi:tetratricopeptide repeat protein [Deinococcus radiopugnans]|uniref:tetratricopeptide repeat protein n=1 Tax=Deinococcus radiopugnans TaxID=57497 RepID=UPI0036061BD8
MTWLTLGVLCAPLSSSADAASTVRGLMDLHKPPPSDQLPCPIFPRRPVPGNASQATNPQMAQQLALLEKQLAQMPPQSEGYRQLRAALDALKAGLKQEQAAQPAVKVLEYRKLSVVQALANLYGSLADHLSPEAWKEWVENAALSDPDRADRAAVLAVGRGVPLLAVAAYLKVLEKTPKNADALFNLGSLAAVLGAPNEALALLDASQARGAAQHFLSARRPAPDGPGVRADAGEPRQGGRATPDPGGEAGPRMAEAQRNLAAALGNQGKCGPARAAVARSSSRHTLPQKSASTSPAAQPSSASASPVPLPIPIPAADQKEDTDYNLRDVLDFSRGTVGEWPYFATVFDPYDEAKLDRRAAEYEQMKGKLDPKTDAAHLSQVQRGVANLLTSVRNDRLSGPRIRLLHTGQFQLFRETRFTALYSKLGKDLATYQKNEQDAMTHLKGEFANADAQHDAAYRACDSATDNSYCRDKAEYDQKLKKCSSLVTWNNMWRGSSSFVAHSVRPLVEEIDLFYTTVISYASEPRLLAGLRLHHQMIRKTFISIVPGYFSEHLSTLDRMNEPCLYIARTMPPKPVPDDQMGVYTELVGNGCKPAATATVKVMLVQFGMNCEKVSVELAKTFPGTSVGLFANVERRASAGARQGPPPPATNLSRRLARATCAPSSSQNLGSRRVTSASTPSRRACPAARR